MGRVDIGQAGVAEEARRRRVVGVDAPSSGRECSGPSLSTRPGSSAFYALTGATALTWTAGGLAAGPLHRGRTPAHRRPIVGSGAHRGGGVRRVLRRGARGAPHPAAGPGDRLGLPLRRQGHRPGSCWPPRWSTARPRSCSSAARCTTPRVAARCPSPRPRTCSPPSATRNPALVLASVVMGALFAAQRRSTGGIQAPLLTHLTWSALMLRFLPPLFSEAANALSASSSRSTSVSST